MKQTLPVHSTLSAVLCAVRRGKTHAQEQPEAAERSFNRGATRLHAMVSRTRTESNPSSRSTRIVTAVKAGCGAHPAAKGAHGASRLTEKSQGTQTRTLVGTSLGPALPTTPVETRPAPAWAAPGRAADALGRGKRGTNRRNIGDARPGNHGPHAGTTRY